jgi:hypothetical protein
MYKDRCNQIIHIYNTIIGILAVLQIFMYKNHLIWSFTTLILLNSPLK